MNSSSSSSKSSSSSSSSSSSGSNNNSISNTSSCKTSSYIYKASFVSVMTRAMVKHHTNKTHISMLFS